MIVATRGATQDAGSSARILVVDDDAAIRDLLDDLLSGLGYQVETAANGHDAIARIGEDSFDVVLTDLAMPGVDGLGVLAKAKELGRTSQVVIMSGYASAESAAQARELGASDYVSKPLNTEQLRLTVQAAARRSAEAHAETWAGICDRGSFHELLDAEIARSERHLRPLSVVIVGLERPGPNGYAVTDLASDARVCRVARLVRSAVRRSDVVASYGKDQLAILLGEADKTGATRVAVRLRQVLEKGSQDGCEAAPCQTPRIRAGVATYPSDALETTHLVSEAQEALFTARTLGSSLVSAAGQEHDLTPLTERKRLYLVFKRFLDIVLSALLLTVTLPFFPLLGLLIKLESPGPMIYSQGRVGLRKRSEGRREKWELCTFRCHKFRTMYHNVSQEPHRAFIRTLAGGELPSNVGDVQGGQSFKLVHDPRVTRVGAVLRKTSLDELPQLINVLRGEMSMVGPRPAALHEAALFQGWRRERFAAPAGLTGLWQVKGRGRVSIDDMLRLDIEYVRNQTLWLDLKILLLTLPAVLSGRGAA
jgi:diguanylate cyclase (GGDEF)-like protein